MRFNKDTKYILDISPIIKIQYEKSDNFCFMASSTRRKFTRNDFRPWTEMPVKFTQWTCFHRTPVCILVLLPPVITLWDLPSYPPPVMPADTIFPPTQTYNLSSGAQTYGFSYSFHSKTSYIWSETNLSLLISLAPLQLSLFLTLTNILKTSKCAADTM